MQVIKNFTFNLKFNHCHFWLQRKKTCLFMQSYLCITCSHLSWVLVSPAQFWNVDFSDGNFLHFLLQQSYHESSLIQTNRITLSRCKSIKLRYSKINPSSECFHWNISTNLPNYSLHRSFKSFKSCKLFTTWIFYVNLVNLTYLAQPLLAARWKRWQHNA